MLNFMKNVFGSKPKKIPPNHKECPICEGTGDYDPLIDCLNCDGKGYIHNNEYYDKLNAGEFRRDY